MTETRILTYGTELWRSHDGLVAVLTNVYFPDVDTNYSGVETDHSGVERAFRDGVWVLVWKDSQETWKITRSRQHPWPNLFSLAQEFTPDQRDLWVLHASGTAGRQRHEETVTDDDAVEIAQALYTAWCHAACKKLPGKITTLRLDPDDFAEEHIPRSLRPGIPTFRAQRRAMREAYEEDDE